MLDDFGNLIGAIYVWAGTAYRLQYYLQTATQAQGYQPCLLIECCKETDRKKNCASIFVG